jgi:Tfp pilus assembly protein PilX
MNNRGVALVISYMVIAVLSVLGSAVLTRTVSEKNICVNHSNSTRAFWVAEAGLQQGIRAFKNNDWSGWSELNATTKSLSATLGNSGEYSVTVSGLGSSSVVIASSGYSPGIGLEVNSGRTVTASYSRSMLFSAAAFGKSRVTLNGNASTDSYNSGIGAYGGINRGTKGDVITNGSTAGAITLTGSSTVNGNADTAPAGTVLLGPASRVTGSITHTNNDSIGEVSVPSELSGATSSTAIEIAGSTNQVLPSGNYKMPKINVSGNAQLTLSGDVNIYLTDAAALDITGSGRLVVLGNAKIYIDGSANISGAGVVNNSLLPEDFMLYGTSSSTSIQVSGSGVFYGGIYAPEASISVTGNGGVYGGVVGDAITVSGSSSIHFDEALSGISSGGGYIFGGWREIQSVN